MTEIVYISGPITGVPNYREAFTAAFCRIAASGRLALNPAFIEGDDSWTWQQWMKAALKLQLEADVVHMLPGWRKSRGARIERRLALILGQRVEGADE